MATQTARTVRWHPDGARRDVIARQAARLFALRGYHGASLREIAATSGVRQPTLYSHYPSKDAILLEVVNRYFDALLPRLEQASDAPGNAAHRMGAMLRAAVEVGVEQRNEFLTTSNNWEIIKTNPDLAVLTDRRDAALALWRSVLTDGAHEGSLRSVDSYAVLWIIASAVNGMADLRYAATGADASPPTETLISVLVDGLAPR
ncbi:MAG TPA: TetR/AcrR family transcriptional regulator [Acidimicrobiales bacterium]|nr:TetR/AcrR family transcriptional regulator [Acidimicrobiales bacterium]